jgi:glycoside/pentoside/hexuronide:cation symporter, GPH family
MSADSTPSASSTAPADRVPTGRRLAYGAGAYADNFMQNGIGNMANPFFNLALGLHPALVGLALSIPRLWDAITDPIMGNITDRARTRWGRRRPFIFAGAILSGLLFALLWFVPSDWGQFSHFFWFLGISLLFYTAYTVFAVPFVALGFELTPDYHERTRVLAVRTFFGSLAGISIQWMFWLTQRPVFDGTAEGMRYVGVGVGLLIAGLGCCTAIFIPERKLAAIAEGQRPAPVPLRTAIGQTLAVPAFRLVLVVLVAMAIGLFTVHSLGFYVNVYHVHGGDAKAAAAIQGWNGTAYHVTTLLTLPLITWASTRFGKRRTLFACLLLPFFGTLTKWFTYTPELPWLQLLTPVLLAPGMACLWTLLGSMVADICDVDELKHGERREGLFGAVYGWVFKLGLSAALVIGGYVLDWTGFDAALGGAQSPGTLTAIRVVFTLVPALGIAIALVLVARFPITESDARATRAELERRRS